MRTPYAKRQLLFVMPEAGLTATREQQVLAASVPPVFTPTADTAWVGIGTGAFAPHAITTPQSDTLALG